MSDNKNKVTICVPKALLERFPDKTPREIIKIMLESWGVPREQSENVHLSVVCPAKIQAMYPNVDPKVLIKALMSLALIAQEKAPRAFEREIESQSRD